MGICSARSFDILFIGGEAFARKRYHIRCVALCIVISLRLKTGSYISAWWFESRYVYTYVEIIPRAGSRSGDGIRRGFISRRKIFGMSNEKKKSSEFFSQGFFFLFELVPLQRMYFIIFLGC